MLAEMTLRMELTELTNVICIVQNTFLFSSRKDQNLLSPVNCWYLLLNQVGSACLCLWVRLVFNKKNNMTIIRLQPASSR